MQLNITTLSDNICDIGLIGEWGLSIFIEVDGLTILFDTGSSNVATHNAHRLKIDLSATDKIILSHGHFDHTGGLRDVLKETGQVEIIAHPDIWKSKRAGVPEMHHYIGIPFQREELETLGAVFNMIREPFWLTENIVTTGEIPMVTDYEVTDPVTVIKEGDEILPDTLTDDLGLIIRTDEGLVVIVGCAHRGIINTLIHARNLTGEAQIRAVLGGIHLFNASEERLERTIADLKEMNIKQLGVSHCTGLYPSARLRHELGETFFFNHAGTKFTL